MTIARAILKINPNATFTVNGNDVDQITWLDSTSPISKSDIEAQASAVELDMALEELRTKRNKLLAETDYFALSDVTMSSEMTTYRESLRDLTNGLDTVQKVNAVSFPTKP
ncbi:putative tail assembly chaperone [uncultured Mediterranean phage uvMED]|nr:putative tail assembly chaperone [uncultured Mediterranean phage uvMED]BAR17563.1 putative tail assembly chaperone [uncultured Mediterranean phage uvMED]